MIPEKLKQSTAAFHQLTEELNFSKDLSSGSIRKEDYVVLLKRLHSLFAQVAILQKMQVLENTIPAGFFEDKARLVYKDISALEDKFVKNAAPFRQMPYHEYLGFCYVAMGSMLGGQIIYRNIINMEVQATHPLPCAFYASCKDSVMEHWRSFMNSMQRVDEEKYEPIKNGATTAYLYFVYLCEVINNVRTHAPAGSVDCIDR